MQASPAHNDKTATKKELLIAGVSSKLLSDPVKDVSKTITVACNPFQPGSWAVLHRDGVFYATVPVTGEESTFEVALHGVRSESEAQQAIALFSPPGPRALAFSN